jgi:hypothetical protein
MSVHWNQRLQGDVNQFALTARQFYRESRLEYPAKIDFFGSAPYESLKSQAAQHPPLFPFLGGVVAKLTRNPDTFLVLRYISFVVGLVVPGLVAVLARDATPPASIPVALVLALFMPIMVDYSGNGSPYILLAAILAGVTLLLVNFDPERRGHYVLLGILLALGFMVHGASNLAVPGIVWFLGLKARSLRIRYITMLCAACLLTLAPMMIWNMSYRGVPIYSTSTAWIRLMLGTIEVGIRDGIITSYPSTRTLPTLLKSYVRGQWPMVQEYLAMLAFSIGPGMLLLAVIGLKRLLDEGTIPLVTLFGPAGSYLVLICFLPQPRTRYILPVLPILCVLAAVGYQALTAVGRRGTILATLFLLVIAAWWVADYRLSPNQTRYYFEDTTYPAQYDAMKELALRMRTLEPGVVLGYSGRIDAGLEAVYYHDMPFVWGRGGYTLLNRGGVEKLVKDLHISYIWTDEDLLPNVQKWFPTGRVVMANPPFCVLDVRPNEDRDGSSPRGSPDAGQVFNTWTARRGDSPVGEADIEAACRGGSSDAAPPPQAECGPFGIRKRAGTGRSVASIWLGLDRAGTGSSNN